MHPGQGKAFTCPECGQTCADNRALGKHLQTIHKLSTWDYRCAECGYRGDTARAVGTHLRTCKGLQQDDPARQVACQYCPKKFASFQGLQVHVSRKHPEEYNEQLPTKRTMLWSQLELDELARTEIEVRQVGVRDINQELSKRFPHRTTSAIATIRKGRKHKARISLLERVRGSQTSNTDSVPEGYACSDNGHAPPEAKPESNNADTNAPEWEANCEECPCRDAAKEKLQLDLDLLPRPLTELDHLVAEYCKKHIEGEAEGNEAWLIFLERVEPLLSNRTEGPTKGKDKGGDTVPPDGEGRLIGIWDSKPYKEPSVGTNLEPIVRY